MYIVYIIIIIIIIVIIYLAIYWDISNLLTNTIWINRLLIGVAGSKQYFHA